MTTIAIANPAEAVGRTTTCIALATFFGSVGARVLLVDCDTNGDLTAVVGRSTGVTADDVESGRATTDQIVAPSRINHVDLFATTGLGHKSPQTLSDLFAPYGYVITDCGADLDALGTEILLQSQLIVIPLPAEPAWERELTEARQFVDDAWVRGARVTVLPTFTTASPSSRKITALLQERYPGTTLQPGIPFDPALESMLDAGLIEQQPTPGWNAYQQVASAISVATSVLGAARSVANGAI